jgi:hypothetical protein
MVSSNRVLQIADMWLIGGTVADVMIAATMTAVLLQRSTDPSTRKMVKSVVVLIVETNSFSGALFIHPCGTRLIHLFQQLWLSLLSLSTRRCQ